GAGVAEHRLEHAAFAGVFVGFEPVDRADPSGLLEEPDQRAADRFVQPDARRHQRRGGQQPGAIDPSVDRGVRARARQPEPAERAATAPLISAKSSKDDETAGGTPAVFLWRLVCGSANNLKDGAFLGRWNSIYRILMVNVHI